MVRDWVKEKITDKVERKALEDSVKKYDLYVADVTTCPQCEMKIPRQSKYCLECGVLIDAVF